MMDNKQRQLNYIMEELNSAKGTLLVAIIGISLGLVAIVVYIIGDLIGKW